MFLLGLGELLPTTRTGLRAEACSAEYVPMLLCQVLERLFYPMSEVTLLLRIRCPVDSAPTASTPAVAQESEKQPDEKEPAVVAEVSNFEMTGSLHQPKEFVEVLRRLESDG